MEEPVGLKIVPAAAPKKMTPRKKQLASKVKKSTPTKAAN